MVFLTSPASSALSSGLAVGDAKSSATRSASEALAQLRLSTAVPSWDVRCRLYMHALRRHWLAVVLAGALGSALCGISLWMVQTPTCVAAALLQITTREPSLMFRGNGSTDEEFRIYKHTQQRLLASAGLLNESLARPEVAALGIIRQRPDAAAWLSAKLDVSFPDDAEIMKVGLEGRDPAELTALLNGVLHTYLERVAKSERNEHKEQLETLNRIYRDREAEIRTKRASFRQLMEQAQARDRFLLSPSQHIAEAVRMDLSLHILQGELKTRHERLSRVDDPDPSEADLLAAAQADPLVGQLTQELAQVRQAAARTAEIAEPSAVARFAADSACKIANLQQQLNVRLDELKDRVKATRQAQATADIGKIEEQIGVLKDARQQLASDLQGQQRQWEQTAQSSADLQQAIDIEMLRAEIDRLEAVLESISKDRARLTDGYRAASRITLVQPATIVSTGSRMLRMLSLVLGMLAGFALPAICVLNWDISRRQVVSPMQVSEELNLPVLGTIASGVRRRASPHRQALDSSPAGDSIDQLVVSLLHGAEQGPQRLLVISSAEPCEQSSELAQQLAQGLSKIGQRTLLVDAELREPRLHAAFGLSLGPGLCDVLRADCDPCDAVQTTDTENLCLLAAGDRDERAYRALTRGAAESVFIQLEAEYDFVIVDASPILTATDSRLLARHADLVILSIVRYVSRAPQIQRARESLASLGVSRVAAVVADPQSLS